MVALQRSQNEPEDGRVMGSCVQLSPVAASPKQRQVLGEHNQAWTCCSFISSIILHPLGPHGYFSGLESFHCSSCLDLELGWRVMLAWSAAPRFMC